MKVHGKDIQHSYFVHEGLSSLAWYDKPNEVGVEFWIDKEDGMMLDFVNHATFVVARRFCGVPWLFV